MGCSVRTHELSPTLKLVPPEVSVNPDAGLPQGSVRPQQTAQRAPQAHRGAETPWSATEAAFFEAGETLDDALRDDHYDDLADLDELEPAEGRSGRTFLSRLFGQRRLFDGR